VFLKKNNGFSLVQVIVAAGIMGGLSLVFMQLIKNTSQSQKFAESKGAEQELKTTVRLLLDDPRHCRVSLAGNGPEGNPSSPVKFYKKDIDEANEGLGIELFTSNQAGDSRSQKRLSSTDPDKNNYDGVVIKSIRLKMNNGDGFDYSEASSHSDIGLVEVIADKKISMNETREVVFVYDLRVEMSTDSSGETTILGCGRDSIGEKQYYFPYKFGGMYSTGCSVSRKINPVTGGYSCPSGFSETVIYKDDFACWDNIDAYIYVCLGKDAGSGVSFGGLYSTGAGARPNPVTGGAGCPTGFTSSVVYRDDFSAWDNIDANVYLCHSGPTGSDFYGMFQTGIIERPNPLVGYIGCPPGTSAQSVYFDSFAAWDNRDAELKICL
jgi:type II secretory pathway pseudopilin PulG